MMPSTNPLNRIVEQHLCMGCGTCAAARPDLISMRDTETGGRSEKEDLFA